MYIYIYIYMYIYNIRRFCRCHWRQTASYHLKRYLCILHVRTCAQHAKLYLVYRLYLGPVVLLVNSTVAVVLPLLLPSQRLPTL